jgi:hypothetical protein
MEAELQPNFFIIGAAKCGTTSLHFYLDHHPEIAMADPKEPHVFADSRSLHNYRSYDGMFRAGTRMRGDSSTGYSRYPAEGDAASRIHAAIPDARLIYVVGEPVERLVSDYAQQLAVGVEPLTFEQAFDDYEDPANFYMCASRYATQVENYLTYFDSSQLLVLEQWALRHERRVTLREVFEFLGVDPDFWTSGFEPEIGTRQEHVQHDSLLWRLRASWVGAAYRKLPVGPRLRISRALRRRIGGAPPRPEFTPERREAITELLIPELDRLRELTGRPFAHLPGATTASSPQLDRPAS